MLVQDGYWISYVVPKSSPTTRRSLFDLGTGGGGWAGGGGRLIVDKEDFTYTFSGAGGAGVVGTHAGVASGSVVYDGARSS